MCNRLGCLYPQIPEGMPYDEADRAARPAPPSEGLREALIADIRALGYLTPEDWDEHRGGDPIARTVNAVEDIIQARFDEARSMTEERVREAHAGSQSARSSVARPAPPSEGLDDHDRIIELLRLRWREVPSQRLGQLLMNLSRTAGGFEDLWEVRNDEWLDRLALTPAKPSAGS